MRVMYWCVVVGLGVRCIDGADPIVLVLFLNTLKSPSLQHPSKLYFHYPTWPFSVHRIQREDQTQQHVEDSEDNPHRSSSRGARIHNSHVPSISVQVQLRQQSNYTGDGCGNSLRRGCCNQGCHPYRGEIV